MALAYPRMVGSTLGRVVYLTKTPDNTLWSAGYTWERTLLAASARHPFEPRISPFDLMTVLALSICPFFAFFAGNGIAPWPLREQDQPIDIVTPLATISVL